MKLRSILLTALAASTTLAACDKSENSGAPTPEDKMPKGVTLSLPNLNPTTRAVGDAIKANSQVELQNFKVFFVKGNTVVTDQELTYDGNVQKTYFSNTDADWATITESGRDLVYHFLPYETTKVVVVGNLGNVEYSALASMTTESVPNDNGTGDANHPLYQLYGEDDLTEGGAPDDKSHQNIYQATVTLAPRVSRFEIYGFEYQAAEAPATNKYARVELQKIALNNYYTQYDFVTMAPVASTKVSGTITEATAWTWIQDQAKVQTAWWNELTLNLAPGEKKFVNGDAITDPAEDGEEATGIITYGLAHVTDKANNPELLLSLYGVTVKESVETKYPLYLHAKFNGEKVTDNPAFAAGKIYRVFFSFTDENIEQPQRCVELNVQVANWTVVPVTPEF